MDPAMDHYRCYRCYITKTNAERVSDTVQFFPKHVRMPQTSSADAAIRAAPELTSALQNPTPATPFHALSDQKLEALRQLSDLFSAALPGVGGGTQPDQPTPSPNTTPILGSPVASRTRHQIYFIDQPNRHANFLEQPEAFFHPVANAVTHPVTGKAMEYRDLIRDPLTQEDWFLSAANAFGRLAQGVGNRIKGTDTIFFIRKDEVPRDRTVTYARFVCTYRPQKSEPNQTRLTVGGNLIDYPGNVSTRTADLTTVKCLLNSTVCTPNAKFMCVNVKTSTSTRPWTATNTCAST